MKMAFTYIAALILCFLQPVLVIAQQCAPAPAGLISWYPGEGNADDIAGPNDGALQGDSSFSQGKVDESFYFDSSSGPPKGAGYVEVPHDVSLTPQHITILAWIRPHSFRSFMSVVNKAGNGANQELGYTLEFGGSPNKNRLWFFLFDGGWQTSGMSNTALPANEWTHVAASFDGLIIRLYINGVQDVAYAIATNMSASPNPLHIGSNPSDPSRNKFAGDIDEVMIFNQALPGEVINEIFLAGSFGVCKDNPDEDGDGINDEDDNCPSDPNPDQADNDLDGEGDVCDIDDDNDGSNDDSDNCPLVANDQTDTDQDGIGDVCDVDLDGDGVENGSDNCPNTANPEQTNTDGDSEGDICDEDDDNDGSYDTDDNCPVKPNEEQADRDNDGIGDACDFDVDGDGIDNGVDNCPMDANVGQDDHDQDGQGDACDDDVDGDSVPNGDDNCPLTANPWQEDADGDGVGDACNEGNDRDGDEWSDTIDNCPDVSNTDQYDIDGDGTGDACDTDIDGDEVANGQDRCAETILGELVNNRGCSIDQLCPCDGPRGVSRTWRNHRRYVSCVARAAFKFHKKGLISWHEKLDIVSQAAASDCGRENTVPARISWVPDQVSTSSVPGETTDYSVVLEHTGSLPIPATRHLRVVAEGGIEPYVEITQPTFPNVFWPGQEVTVEFSISIPNNAQVGSIRDGELMLKRALGNGVTADVWRAKPLPLSVEVIE